MKRLTPSGARLLPVAGSDWRVKLHPVHDGVLPDPELAGKRAGEFYSAQSVGMLVRGPETSLIYRWWTEQGVVTAELSGCRPTGRHPYKPLFRVAGSELQIETSCQKLPHREGRAVWHQDGDELAAAVGQAYRLHTRLSGWVRDFPSPKPKV